MITTKELRDYIPLKALLSSLDEEIQSLYYPVASPNKGEKVGGKVSTFTPGNPTADAANRVIALKDKRDKVAEKLKEIETFIDSIEDNNVMVIVRLHYEQGYSWAETCYKVYGYYNADTTKKAVYRYVKGQK